MTNPDLGNLMGSYNACLEEIDRLRTRIHNGCGSHLQSLLEWVSSSGIRLSDVQLPGDDCPALIRELAAAVRRKRDLDDQLRSKGLDRLIIWL
ncbi:MAG: hypothetical protein F4185_02800 [Chloroflexi bacterium]|nr:hypothetical protein [Chloroflexota bacterium]MYA50916.1 hypothetical protein [Chloroflexota bacterium]MYF64893.1 hypothetical protein [Chloroflexota bacterium]MYK35663.1 hypothetical protein [Chloroflexota bacterium]